MTKVVVTGISLISCLGDKNQTWQGIIEGKSAIKIAQPFSHLPPLPLGLIGDSPTSVRHLTLKLVSDLCEDAQIYPPLEDTAVIIGSSRGCQSDWEDFLTRFSNGDRNFSPPWLQTLPSQPAIITANYLQTSAMTLSPNNACATGLLAISQGYELIKQEKYQRIIIGAVECPITPLTITGFQKMKALSSNGCYPFAKARDGFVLGEGGAMLMLESEECALSRHARIYGEILAWATNCDAQSMASPEFSAKIALKAVGQCLMRSQLQPEDIDYIHCHGTATILNDQREAKIIASLFPHNPNISSTKGATGHTLGASGAIATVLSFMSLQQQRLLPHISLPDLEFDLNFCQKSREYPLRNILCFGFGFGGQNTILAIKGSKP